MGERIMKPPIGLTPKFVRKRQRINEISEAIVRYLNTKMVIPAEWIEEYNQLIKEETE